MVLTEDQADGGSIVLVPELVIDDAEVKVHFARIFRLEFTLLQVNDHVAAQTQMVEKQVEIVFRLADFDTMLPPHKGKALAQFEKETLKLMQQVGFQFAFVERLLQGEEIEDIGVFESLLNKVGLGGGKEPVEIGEGFTRTPMGSRFDHQVQHVAAPAVRKGLVHVPEAGGKVFDLLHENDVMCPWNCPEE